MRNRFCYRSPKLYKDLLGPKVDFLKGGYTYPVIKEGREVPAR